VLSGGDWVEALARDVAVEQERGANPASAHKLEADLVDHGAEVPVRSCGGIALSWSKAPIPAQLTV